MKREYPDAPLAGVGAVVINDGGVLLVRRVNEPLKGEWSLPGGLLELGETLRQGVVREVLEETCLTIQPLFIVETFDRIVRDDDGRVRYHYVLVDWVCRVVSGTLCCADDAADARWVPRREVNEQGEYRLAPFTVAVIEKAFQMTAETAIQEQIHL